MVITRATQTHPVGHVFETPDTGLSSILSPPNTVVPDIPNALQQYFVVGVVVVVVVVDVATKLGRISSRTRIRMSLEFEWKCRIRPNLNLRSNLVFNFEFDQIWVSNLALSWSKNSNLIKFDIHCHRIWSNFTYFRVDFNQIWSNRLNSTKFEFRIWSNSKSRNSSEVGSYSLVCQFIILGMPPRE